MASMPYSSDSKPTDLPVELLVIVSEFLAGDHCLGTLANFNVASSTVHQETLPVLYETAVWRYEERRDAEKQWAHSRSDRGWKYVK
jgi:hypothetical protein